MYISAGNNEGPAAYREPPLVQNQTVETICREDRVSEFVLWLDDKIRRTNDAYESAILPRVKADQARRRAEYQSFTERQEKLTEVLRQLPPPPD